MTQFKNTEMIEPKVGLTLTETKKGMKKVINGKTYNTETSKKVCGFDVNGWTHELYQTKSGEYFTYIYDELFIEWYKNHSMELPNRGLFSRETINLVTESEVKHILERSGSVDLDRGDTVLTELKDYFSVDNIIPLSVTGKSGFVHFDFGSWEVTMDIDDESWVKMIVKGKVVYEKDELNMIEYLRRDWKEIRSLYLNGRFGSTK